MQVLNPKCSQCSGQHQCIECQYSSSLYLQLGNLQTGLVTTRHVSKVSIELKDLVDLNLGIDILKMSPRRSLNMGKTFQDDDHISGYASRSKDLNISYIKTIKSNDKKNQLIWDSKEISNPTHKHRKNKSTKMILKKSNKLSHTCKL